MKADIVSKAIIFNPKLKRILLLQRCGTDDIGAGTWENAGGNIEDGEDPEAAVIREVREEAGLTDIAVKRVAYVAVLPHKPVLIIVYLCQTDSEAVTLSDEHQAYIWADKSDCLRLLPDGIISDFEKNNVFDMLT